MLHDAIAAELVVMAERDQAMRRQAAADRSSSGGLFDRPHAERLREITTRIGWPTRSRVGDTAEHAAWLIAQHADHDVELQKQCLALMRAEPATEVCARHLAYLEDRIAVHEARPQRFGTQLRGTSDGAFEPSPLAEPERVDDLRAGLGLEPLADYVRRVNARARSPG